MFDHFTQLYDLKYLTSVVDQLAEAAAFMRSDDVRLVLPDSYQIKDETSGPDAPDLESFVVPLAYPIAKRLIPNPPGDLMTMGTVLSRYAA